MGCLRTREDASEAGVLDKPSGRFHVHRHRGPQCEGKPMRYAFILCAFALMALGQKPAPMPEPGNPGHVEPAKDAFCRNFANDPPEHKCECDRKCVPNAD